MGDSTSGRMYVCVLCVRACLLWVRGKQLVREAAHMPAEQLLNTLRLPCKCMVLHLL